MFKKKQNPVNNDSVLLVNEYEIEDINKLDIPLNTSLILKISHNNKNFDKILKKSISDGFKYPVVKMENNILRLYLYCNYNHNFGQQNNIIDSKKVLDTVNFTINNFKTNIKDFCKISIKIDKKALTYLSNYTKKYKFKFENSTEQREISGVFKLLPSTEKNVFNVSIDDKITNTGKKEETDSHDTIGSFHTHPREAYIKYNVCSAWPSTDDYCTFLQTYYNGYGFFHIVSCLEGLYIITISETLFEIPLGTIKENFNKYDKSIRDNYDYLYSKCGKDKEKMNFDEIKNYVKEINEKPYFVIQFVKWEDASKPIKIIYNSKQGNCFVTDEQIRFMSIIKDK